MPRNDIQKQGRILMLPVDCIEPSPYQARTAFDEPEIAALAVSILQNGLLQPISVRRVGLHIKRNDRLIKQQCDNVLSVYFATASFSKIHTCYDYYSPNF